MGELVRVAVRIAGVVVPAVGLLGVSELRGGAPSGDFGTYLEAILLAGLVAGGWAAGDARRFPASRTALRWTAVGVVAGSAAGVVSTVLAPGGPPGELVGQAISLSAFHAIPLLLAAAVGVAAAGGRRSPVS